MKTLKDKRVGFGIDKLEPFIYRENDVEQFVEDIIVKVKGYTFVCPTMYMLIDFIKQKAGFEE